MPNERVVEVVESETTNPALRGDVDRGMPLLERALAEAETSGVVIDQTVGSPISPSTLLWAGRRAVQWHHS